MQKISSEMIAPCGMNCRLCIAYQRNKKKCAGCRGDDNTKPVHCVKCSIKCCPMMQSSQAGYCFDCSKYPCRRLRQLDARYRANYKMSMLENLDYIKQNGMTAFLTAETERWLCKNCGEIICVHNGLCLHCSSAPGDANYKLTGL